MRPDHQRRLGLDYDHDHGRQAGRGRRDLRDEGHLAHGLGRARQRGDFVLAEVQQNGTAPGSLDVIFDTRPFWLFVHTCGGAVSAVSGASGTVQVKGQSYPFVLENDVDVLNAACGPVTLTAGASGRMRASMFRGTLYVGYATMPAGS